MGEKIKRSLKYSFLDGIFASCMFGLIAEYIIPYALALKATTKQIGFLSSLPNLFSSLFQLKSADITERLGSRKKIIDLSVFLHAFMLIPILSIPFLFKKDPVFWLILFITLFSIFGAFAVGPWLSLMSEHIPEDKRGEYFGWRNKILGFISVGAGFLSGFILQRFKQDVFRGFLIIFSLACICRFASWYFLKKMYEPRFKVSKEHYFSFLDFIKGLKESNFAKFVFFVALFNFSVNLVAPFLTVLMLRDLKFNYLTYTIVVLSATLATLFTIDRWGLHADRVGNIKIIRLTSLFISFIPLLWIIYRHPLYLVFVQIFAGFAWSGFNLCVSNFILDSVSKEKRTRCISYFNVINGVFLCLGPLIGGYLITHLPSLFGYRILTLLLISSILRFFVFAFFIPRIREVRKVERIRSKDLFYSMIGIKPALGISTESLSVLRREDRY